MIRKLLAPLPALALLFPLAGLAQTLPAGVEKKASMGGITEYDYPNGLRVLLYPDTSNNAITVCMTVLVGSRHEGYGETGMAHLLEHLDFIETVDGRQLKNEITAHATNWNGTTNADRTNYYETFVASDDNLKWALGLEADRLVKVKFTKQILDTEMTVVRNEFERGENSPQSILRERVEATAYLWHNYGKSTIGSKEDIEKVPVNRLEEFYHKFYQPDNAFLVVTGRIDESKTLQMVADTLGRIPRPTRVLDQTYTVEPAQDGQRFVELRRVGQGQQVDLAYHVVSAGHPDSAPLAVLSAIMSGSGGGGGRGGRGGGGAANDGRLHKALVDTKLATSAGMSFEQRHDPGLVFLTASLTDQQSPDAAKKALIEAMADVVKNPPTKEEIERVKTGMLRNLESQLSNAVALGTGLSSPISEGDWRLMFLAHDRLKDVQPADIVRVAKAYFKESNMTVGYYIPDAAPDRTVVPPTPDLSSTLANYKSTVTISHGEAFDATPATIESRVVRTKLANGMKLVMLPKKTENDMAEGTIELRFGDAASLAGKRAAAQFADSLLGQGTKEHTAAQLRDEMQKLNARISVGAGGGGGGRGGRGGRGGGGGGAVSSVNASITAPAANFEAAMRLAVEMLKDPLYPQAEFDRALQQRIRGLQQPQTEPTQLATEILTRQLTPWSKGDLMYQGTREEQVAELQKVTLDDVRKFHDQFYGANYGVMAVVGPVDRAGVEKTAGELLGTWNTRMAYKPVVARYKKADAINRKIETPDKANAQFDAGLRFQMAESDPDYPAMLLAGYIFGGPITSHISDRIRNREGLSYGANARIAIPNEGDDAELSGTVTLNPMNGPKVEFSFVDELKRTIKDGFTAEEVAAMKKAYLDSRLAGRSDAGLLGQLAQHELQGRTFQWDAQLEQKIAALTPEQVSAAFRKHIDPAALSIVKAGDFKAAGVYQ